MPIRTIRFATFALGACLVAATTAPAFALGGSSGSDNVPTCKKGEVYDQKSKKCVKQRGASISDENRADYAYALAKAHRYQEALDMLDTMTNQNTAEAWNYRGYATRKLGRTDEGISYYLKSVDMDPKYARVREYLGEAYVIKGQIDLAKEQLNTIKSLCGTTCEEYRDLNEAIENPSKI
ncbi:tetratricopeptide repeat protein [Rhizobium sp. RAF56]|jgi:tetratricopeptide (TPR) repeat protein|uniref:tetratricopeptide repeat protein n=1 Tax=Rhizobium sp. RAF56 TaxID=3233062 RepID=UPI003F98BD3A